MKRYIKYILTVFLTMILTLYLCTLYKKSKILNFKETMDYNYIENNKNKIDKIILKTDTLLGEHCYLIDNSAINTLKNIEIKKETNMKITDSDKYYQIYFKTGKVITIKFEGENLEYDGKKYILKNQIVDYKKEIFLPEKIDEYMIIFSQDDEIECNN